MIKKNHLVGLVAHTNSTSPHSSPHTPTHTHHTPTPHIHIRTPTPHHTHRVTYKKLFDEVECLRLLSTSSVVDPDQLHKLYSEIVTQCSKMGMEFEALSRFVCVDVRA